MTKKKFQSFSAFDSLFNMQCITATGNIFIFCIIYCITCQSSITYKLASGFLYKTGEGGCVVRSFSINSVFYVKYDLLFGFFNLRKIKWQHMFKMQLTSSKYGSYYSNMWQFMQLLLIYSCFKVPHHYTYTF